MLDHNCTGFLHILCHFVWCYCHAQIVFAGVIIFWNPELFEVIYQTWEAVFQRHIQAPRRELKIRRAAEYFDEIRGVWIADETVSGEKIRKNLCLLRPGIQTSFTVVIFFVLNWWIINVFEKFPGMLDNFLKPYGNKTCKINVHCTYPVSDFWQSSSCSNRWGSSWPSVSSPTQHWTTLGVSCARVMIFTQDLSMFANRLASCQQSNNNSTKEEAYNTCL